MVLRSYILMSKVLSSEISFGNTVLIETLTLEQEAD